jgi:hypothetical protein
VPGKLFFFPLLNTVTPVIVLACVWLAIRSLQTARSAYAALLGLSFYALLLFEPLPFVTGPLFVALGIHAVRQRNVTARTVARQTTVAVVSSLPPWRSCT